jgi:hypothetical protein
MRVSSLWCLDRYVMTTTAVTARCQLASPLSRWTANVSSTEVLVAFMYLPGGLFVHLLLGQHDGLSG